MPAQHIDIQNIVKRVFSITDKAAFGQVALEVFYHQCKYNQTYSQYIHLIGKNPEKIHTVEEIPFLPVEFFKTHQILSSQAPVQETFSSSGTTGTFQSKHFITDLSVYQSSFRKTFELFYGDIKQYCIIGLLPSYLERGGSSLVYMVNDFIQQSENKHSGFYLHKLDELIDSLQYLNDQQQPTILIGVTYALLDLAEKIKEPLQNITIMETGGMKGKRKEITREELHCILCEKIEVPSIHSEYGMTELLSQAYSKGNGLFTCPPWMKVLPYDPNDPLDILTTSQTAGINIIDLANIHSCSFIQTKDVGQVYEDGTFEIHGRFDYSDIRGCNLMVTYIGLLLIFLFSSCSFFNEKKQYAIFCDAEAIENIGDEIVFKTSEAIFENGQTQSNERFFSGKYAAKLTKENRAGMLHTFKNLHSGDELKLSVWMYGNKQNSSVVVDGDWGGAVYLLDSVESKNGWYRIKTDYIVGGENVNISVYPFLKNISDTIYADDFEITYIPATAHAEAMIPKNAEVLNIFIDEKGMKKLKKEREYALKKGILISENEEWITAKLVLNGDSFSAKLRLKGDWTDHLKGNKWSYRIKLKDNKTVNGMNTFSIQNPGTRSYLYEWVFHQLLEKEHILTTKYDFIYVKQNNKSMGLFAVEEHFTENMLKRNGKEKGIITSFSEEEMWNDRLNNGGKDRSGIPYLEASDIKMFYADEIEKSPELSKQYASAKLLMNLYRYHLKPASQIFDVDQLAKYLALIDICGSQHGLIWHNQRMYFNPVTGLLEPIGFDAYTDQGSLSLSNQSFWGAYGIANLNESNQFQYLLFTDDVLYNKYIYYLERYSSEEFLNTFLKTISTDLIKYKSYIQAEKSDYAFTTGYLYANAANIRKALIYFKENSMLEKNIDYLNDISSQLTYDSALKNKQ